MIKKTINYTDFDGNNRTEDVYFNLTKTEMIELSFEMPDVMDDTVDPATADVNEIGRKLIEKVGTSGVWEFVKKLVRKSYGIKSEDGRRFIKSDELATEFTQTVAYDELLVELLTNNEKANEFINALIPAETAKHMTAGTPKLVK